MDRAEPWRVVSQILDPIMLLAEAYELSGFFGQVVFTNGHVVDGDKVTINYGAAHEFVCGACLSIEDILERLI
jgi:predicted GH43/DUF377 family glycosyl hydrolase